MKLVGWNDDPLEMPPGKLDRLNESIRGMNEAAKGFVDTLSESTDKFEELISMLEEQEMKWKQASEPWPLGDDGD